MDDFSSFLEFLHLAGEPFFVALPIARKRKLRQDAEGPQRFADYTVGVEKMIAWSADDDINARPVVASVLAACAMALCAAGLFPARRPAGYGDWCRLRGQRLYGAVIRLGEPFDDWIPVIYPSVLNFLTRRDEPRWWSCSSCD